jgi:3-oxoacyl-[acyl-carrier-protein] synthase III
MLYLHGLGHFHPENEITNKFLEELDIGSSEEWILDRVGIRARRTVLPLDYIRRTKNRDLREAVEAAQYSNAQTSAAAARMALARADLKIEDIGLLISGTSAPDYVAPAEAGVVATELGIEVPCFDMNSACTTFLMQLNFLSKTVPGALPPYILMTNSENASRCIDYSDRRSACIFGDGSVSAIVSTSVPSRMVIESCHYDSKPSGWDKVYVPRTKHFIQDGKAVQGFAIRKTTEGLKALQEIYPVPREKFKFVGHQANLGMLCTVCERCDIDPQNHYHNVVDYGNTASAGAPSALSQNWEKLAPGDYVALVQVGAGLSWAHAMLKVGDV